MNKYSPLSETAKALILGSLLGDGSLKIHEPYKNARYSFRHSIAQSDYFFWKVNNLKEISSAAHIWKQTKDGKDGYGTIKWRYQSKALPALTELFNLTHPRNKFKIRRKWLNLLTPLSLAVWWQDDGSIIANGRKGVLCTDGFNPEEVFLLQAYLRKVWQVDTTLAPGNKKTPHQVRLWFRSTAQLQKFLRIILPFLKVKSMIPKFVLLYHNQQLQQRWISEVSKLSNFPLSVIMQYYHQKKAKWKKYKAPENDIVQSL